MKTYGFFIGPFAAAVLAIMAGASPSNGQTANAAAGSSSSAGSASQSGAAAISGSPTLIVDQRSTNSGNPTTYANGGGDLTIRNVPTIYAPGVVTGNVCALGASAGGAVVGFGLTVAATWESERCELRQQIALFYNMGRKHSGDMLACTLSPTAYASLKSEGVPCAYNAAWEPKGAPPVAATLPVNVAPPVVTPVRTASSFNPGRYATGADCLNAAQEAGAPLAQCRGKP